MSVSIPLQTLFANARAGTVYQTTSAGAIEAVSAETTCTAHWVGGKPHALLQPARTNIIRHSEALGNAAWSIVSGVSVTENTVVAPDGTTSGDNVEVTATGDSRVQQNNTVANDSTTYCGSIFIKKTAAKAYGAGFKIDLTGGTGVSTDVRINTETGAATLGSPRVDDFGDWWRVSATITNNSTGNTTLAFSARAYSGSAVIGQENDFWGAQLEAGAFPTTYIPTTSSAVTRAADNATCSTDTFPIDQNGGSIEIIGRAYYETGGSGFQRVFQIDDGSGSNNIQLTIGESANILILNVTVAGVGQANETLAYTSGDEFHAVLVFAEDNVFLSLGGSNSTPDTTASFPTGLLTTWRWAQSASGNNGAAVLINRIASHSHEFSTTGADAITA